MIAFIVLVVAYLGNPQWYISMWAISALTAAAMPHQGGGWRSKLSYFWLVSVGSFVIGVDMAAQSRYPYKTFVLVIATWCAAATLMWLFGGLKKHKATDNS